MGRLGFEPKTNRLKAECSTAELATRALALVILAQPTGNLARGLEKKTKNLLNAAPQGASAALGQNLP